MITINVELLTAKTILDDSVFDEIIDEKSEIERSKMELECFSRARELGVLTEFKKLLSAWKKEEKRLAKDSNSNQNRTILDGYTNFSFSENSGYENIRCGAWIADDFGIKSFGMFGQEILACYHPILPVKRMENAETGKEKIELAFRKGVKWKTIVVEKSHIASSNKIVSLSDYGVSVTSENAKALVRYLADIENMNVNIIPLQISTSKLGWINDEFMPYCQDVIFDSEAKFKATFDAIRPVGSREKWYKLAMDIRQSKRFEPKIYLVGALASSLLEGLNALPFVINLWGDTGKGKTVALMLAASVWGNPEKDFISDPKSTPTALELRMNFLNNLPLLIDDMAQLKEKYNGDFSELIYMLCAGKGKDRANAGMGLNKSTSWKNVILTNGEHSLITETMQGGAVNRVIDVEMEDGYIFPNGNKVVESIKVNYGWLGFDFIQILKQIGLEQIKEWQQEFLQKINDFAKAKGVEKEEKQTLPMSILLTADKIATDYLFQDGVYLDFETSVDLLKNKGEVSENERAYWFIMDSIGTHINRFFPDQYGDYHGECWGCIDKGYAVINNNIFNLLCEKGNFSRKSFLNWAEKKGYLLTSGKNQTKTKKINGKSVRGVFLKMDEPVEIDELLDNSEPPFDD